MVFQYFPSKGLLVDKTSVDFHAHRDLIRASLHKNYEEDNRIIQLGERNEEPLYMRRDIYNKSADDLFFLSYDEKDCLSEIEIHGCSSIRVLDICFDFKDEIDFVALKLSKYSEVIILSEGEIFFKDLKLVLSDKRKMGSEGSTIGYFYSASDVSHIS